MCRLGDAGRGAFLAALLACQGVLRDLGVPLPHHLGSGEDRLDSAHRGLVQPERRGHAAEQGRSLLVDGGGIGLFVHEDDLAGRAARWAGRDGVGGAGGAWGCGGAARGGGAVEEEGGRGAPDRRSPRWRRRLRRRRRHTRRPLRRGPHTRNAGHRREGGAGGGRQAARREAASRAFWRNARAAASLPEIDRAQEMGRLAMTRSATADEHPLRARDLPVGCRHVRSLERLTRQSRAPDNPGSCEPQERAGVEQQFQGRSSSGQSSSSSGAVGSSSRTMGTRAGFCGNRSSRRPEEREPPGARTLLRFDLRRRASARFRENDHLGGASREIRRQSNDDVGAGLGHNLDLVSVHRQRFLLLDEASKCPPDVK